MWKTPAGSGYCGAAKPQTQVNRPLDYRLAFTEGDTMTDLVRTEDIERIVGIERHQTAHYGRAVSAEQTVYILHSHDCKNSGIDLRRCRYSEALDRGILMAQWTGYEDRPVLLWFDSGPNERLVPLETMTPRNCPT